MPSPRKGFLLRGDKDTEPPLEHEARVGVGELENGALARQRGVVCGRVAAGMGNVRGAAAGVEELYGAEATRGLALVIDQQHIVACMVRSLVG